MNIRAPHTILLCLAAPDSPSWRAMTLQTGSIMARLAPKGLDAIK